MTWLMPGSSGKSPTTYRGPDRLTRALAAVALVWGAAYLVWRLLETRSGAEPVLFAVLLAGEAFGWLMLASFAFLAWRVPAAKRPDIGWRPTADVFVCTYDEGMDVLGATLVGCRRITYPHTTWVLDDGRREPVRELAERFGAHYLTRPTNEHAKAGNVNNALDHTSGQVVLILDADHVPQPDILDATLGYFDDPSVAVVQTPHDFGNQDSFQHFETGRHDQSMFFEVIMPGKDRHDGAFWCGSAAVILRHALEGIGGIATETVAEDFHTTIRLHGQGWHTRYHDETLVQGLAPHDLASFLLQRDRWARGNLAVLRTPENPVVASGLSLKQRLSYLSSLLSYFVPLQRLALLSVLVAMLVSGRLPLHASLWRLAPLWVVWMTLNLGAASRLCRGEVSLWDGTYSSLLTSGIFLRASLVLVHPFRTSFRVTPKDGIDGGGWTAARQLRLVMAMGMVLASAMVVRALAAFGVVPLPSLTGVALVGGLAFAAWELVLIAAALWRVSRRHQVRRHYRVPVQVAGVVDEALVRVVDLTAGGAGVLGPRPVEVGTVVELRLDLPGVGGEMREVRVHFTVCSCRRAEGAGWRMGGTLTPLTAADGEALIEHCHVVSCRQRLTESGRLLSETPDASLRPTPDAARDRAAGEPPATRLTASG
jgi:cellulose synthase (UDP-forming)